MDGCQRESPISSGFAGEGLRERHQISPPMKRVLVWDLPVRLFHWLLAGSFFIAFVIALSVDDDGALFAVHMLLGGVAAFMVLLRIMWGFAGTRWVRFRSFSAGPKALWIYIRDVIAGRDVRFTGHNPGSSIVALTMFVLILGLAFTGVMMGNSGGGVYEDLHEVMAWTMVVAVAVHILGITMHTIRHRENIAKSMVDGRKEADPSGAIPSVRRVVALIFLVLTGLWAGGLIRGYDADRSEITLPLIDLTLHVGEAADH